MQRNPIITNMLRRIIASVVFCLIVLSLPGCLVIGAKNDGNVSERVAIIESRLDNLERLYATSSPQQQDAQQFGQQYGQQSGYATSSQLAEARSGSRVAQK